MGNRVEETRFVKELLRNAVQVRADCPFCGGRQTFSATRDGRRLSWICFRASCNARGHLYVDPTLKDLRESFTEKELGVTKPLEKPGSWVSPLRDQRAVEYLRKNHAMRAYEEGRAEIYWDVATERVVYAIRDEGGTLVDAACRAVQKSPGVPKWLRAHRGSGTTLPFITVPPSEDCIAIVVEDCASACAVSPFAVGVALLGTHLNVDHVNSIRKLGRETFVALDPDATNKGVQMARQLSFVVRATPVRLIEEFKNMSEEETEQWVKQASKTS